jgi:hypothetical protein
MTNDRLHMSYGLSYTDGWHRAAASHGDNWVLRRGRRYEADLGWDELLEPHLPRELAAATAARQGATARDVGRVETPASPAPEVWVYGDTSGRLGEEL